MVKNFNTNKAKRKKMWEDLNLQAVCSMSKSTIEDKCPNAKEYD